MPRKINAQLLLIHCTGLEAIYLNLHTILVPKSENLRTHFPSAHHHDLRDILPVSIIVLEIIFLVIIMIQELLVIIIVLEIIFLVVVIVQEIILLVIIMI